MALRALRTEHQEAVALLRNLPYRSQHSTRQRKGQHMDTYTEAYQLIQATYGWGSQQAHHAIGSMTEDEFWDTAQDATLTAPVQRDALAALRQVPTVTSGRLEMAS